VAQDRPKETTGEHSGLQGMGESPSTLSTSDVDSDHDPQGSGALQLLPSRGERDLVMDLLSGSREIAVQMVESSESTAKPHVAGSHAGIGGLCLPRPDPVASGGNESGACVKTCSSARVSMIEESGAGKLHAGICVGDVG
jgi:hypothetical protein